MGRKRKPTNKELTEGIMYLHQKLDNYFITQQTLFKDYVEFDGKVDLAPLLVLHLFLIQ